ncbi:MAG: RDD family protein [Myxococcales bacterium]|nr:RDD family protein [Myxococcales bacterium]
MGKPRSEKPLDTTTEVETPEHVRFRYQVSGPGRRLLAYVIDLLVRGGVVLAFAILASVAGFAGIGDASTGVLLVIWFLIEWFYYVFWELVWSGRTPGKRALSLRVLSDTGHPLRFGQSFLRNLLRAVDFWPTWHVGQGLEVPTYVVAAVAMGRDARFRRLGDLAAGTMVVVEERVFVERPLVILPPPSAQELSSLPQRIPLSGEELEALELFLRRADRLPPGRIRELAELVAPIFGARIGIGAIRDPFRFLQVVFARTRGIPASPDYPVMNHPPPGPVPFGMVGWQRPGHGAGPWRQL